MMKVARIKVFMQVVISLMALFAFTTIWHIITTIVPYPISGLVLVTIALVLVFSLAFFVWGVSWGEMLRSGAPKEKGKIGFKHPRDTVLLIVLGLMVGVPFLLMFLGISFWR